MIRFVMYAKCLIDNYITDMMQCFTAYGTLFTLIWCFTVSCVC